MELAILLEDASTESFTVEQAYALGQIYIERGDRAQALRWFNLASEIGGDSEIGLRAALEVARHLAVDGFERSVPGLLRAWQRLPTRHEPLLELARGYQGRRAGLSYFFADLAMSTLRSSGPPARHWGDLGELRMLRGVAATELGDRATGKRDLRRVIETDGVPAECWEHARGLVRRPRKRLPDPGDRTPEPDARYAEPPKFTDLVSSAVPRMIELETEPNWSILNPSIASDESGYTMIVRSTNYLGERETPIAPEEPRENRNYLVSLTPSFEIRSHRLIEDRSEIERYPAYRTGFMDCRPIRVGSEWYAVAASDACSSPPKHRQDQRSLITDGSRVTLMVTSGGGSSPS